MCFRGACEKVRFVATSLDPFVLTILSTMPTVRYLNAVARSRETGAASASVIRH